MNSRILSEDSEDTKADKRRSEKVTAQVSPMQDSRSKNRQQKAILVRAGHE